MKTIGSFLHRRLRNQYNSEPLNPISQTECSLRERQRQISGKKKRGDPVLRIPTTPNRKYNEDLLSLLSQQLKEILLQMLRTQTLRDAWHT